MQRCHISLTPFSDHSLANPPTNPPINTHPPTKPPTTPIFLDSYQIRLDSRRCPSTRLLFCTSGVLLRRLAIDPQLAGVTHGKGEVLQARWVGGWVGEWMGKVLQAKKMK
jgi:hypothetical protein